MHGGGPLSGLSYTALRATAGPGVGQPCALCGPLIPRSDTEYELQFTIDTTTLRFHRRCQTAWDTARTETAAG